MTILVTSAGIARFDPVVDITAEKWEEVLGVNLSGTFYCAQAAIPDMVSAGCGPIVTISSSSAQSGAPAMAHYVASEGGVIALTKALARELAGQGITVNTIPPTLVDTPMARGGAAEGNVPEIDVSGMGIPVGRAGTPKDIAAACSFLCSDEAEYITGQLIGVNGGMYSHRPHSLPVAASVRVCPLLGPPRAGFVASIPLTVVDGGEAWTDACRKRCSARSGVRRPNEGGAHGTGGRRARQRSCVAGDVRRAHACRRG